MKNLKSKTKTEIMAMKLKCPFCGQVMVFIENDWTDPARVNGEWHSVRALIFEHELDHIEGKPHIESGCQGGSVSYYFIESKDDSEKQAKEDAWL